MSDYETSKKFDEVTRLLRDIKNILEDISIYLTHIDDNTSQQKRDFLTKKDLPYLKCLNCDRKIYADEIRYKENNTIVICAHCSARNIVRFHSGRGGVLISEFRRLDE